MAGTERRPLSVIAAEIDRLWRPPHFTAVPYIQAMHHLDSVEDAYVTERGGDIVQYFLANAGSWRGEDARRIKAELRALLKK